MRRKLIVAVATMVLSLCGCSKSDEGIVTPSAPPGAPITGVASPAQTGRASAGETTFGGRLGETATCADYLAATEEQREVATRAALIVARRGAGGVRPEPSEETRAQFEIAVGLACDSRRAERMLVVMAAVVGNDPSYVS